MNHLSNCETISVNALPPPAPSAPLTADAIAPCCREMVDKLAHINPMMVCGECKQIIKTFRDDRAYRNYIKFCNSRNRTYTTGFYSNQWLVIFHAYDA